jgi:predicted lipoprotein with Yx(FWY)xxD motif
MEIESSTDHPKKTTLQHKESREMDKPSSRRNLIAIGSVAFSLTLGVAVAAPALAGASTHEHRAQSQGTSIKVGTSKKYGKILESTSGRTLYFLTSESSKSLKCTGPCLALWPPVLTKGKPQAGAGVVAKELGTMKRGSSLQVTYYGHPLYMYSGDKAANQANGEGISAFGGWWYMLSGSGTAVKSASGGSGGSGGGW